MTGQVRPTLSLRNAVSADVPAIVELMRRVYPNDPAFLSRGMLLGQITAYPAGQWVAEYGGDVVGYAASFRIKEKHALKPHTWMEITGNGYAARHDPKGDWLYGMDVAVDPSMRRLRIGQRIYDARKRLCEDEGMTGIVFGGRLPGLAKRAARLGGPEAYLDAVIAKDVRDPVAAFQIRQGFEPIGLLPGYDPTDAESGGYAAHMVWRNPYAGEARAPASRNRRDPTTVRVACVQMQARAVSGIEEFLQAVEYFVDVTSDYKADFVVFPELFTLQLLAASKQKLSPEASLATLTEYTPRLIEAMRGFALSYNINIIGGSHPTYTDDGDIQNVAYVFLRDGSVHAQEKVHPTPDERYWWNIKGGDGVAAIDTDCGPIGVLVCYDSEFPELARKLADEGARILFVPFCTDTRQGYLRVRYCCQARAIENQCYVAMAGNVGNLPNVENMDIQYAQSCILTPCDFPFARDGIAAEASENVETVAVADLNLEDITWARAEGTVRNLRDRRFDLYSVRWTQKD